MSKIDNLLTTDYIYIPYKKDSKIFFKDGDYIYKNDLLMQYNDNNIYSSVSGKILGLTLINNKKYVVIENDYKDKLRKRKYSKKNISDISKEDFIKLMDELNILNNFDYTSKVLIINGLDSYNEEETYNTLINEYTDTILDTIDALITILSIKKCFLAINNNSLDTVNNVINNIGTYPKIDLKMFNNDNMICIKEVLINKLTTLNSKQYNVEVLNIVDIINIYNALKKNIPITTTYLTLNDKINNKLKVLHVNIGTNVNDILKEYKIDNKSVIVNGLISGIKLKDTNFIIDKYFKSIFISDMKEYKELECINCGKCLICPVGINPKYMHFNDDEKAKKYREKCINCGMCEYVCPSKINLTKGDKKC